MKGVIYARYSSDNQREESIEGQLRECKAFAEKNDIQIIETYIDRALSAKTDNRPDFQRMIRESAKEQFEVIIVAILTVAILFSLCYNSFKGHFRRGNMVYGVIDEKSKRYYTYLKDVFAAIGNRQTEFNWLITDTEIVAHSKELDALNTNVQWQYESGKSVAVPAPEFYFLSGEELTAIVSQDNSQWIWGVLSGFDKSVSMEDILKYPLPESNGYEGFWKNPPSIQHPLASVEIVPWDSSLVLVLSKDKEIVDSFRAAFPQSKELSEYNA